MGFGSSAVEIPLPHGQRVLKLSLEEARQLGHNYIGTEHLLLGLSQDGEGVAARVLENLGVSWKWASDSDAGEVEVLSDSPSRRTKTQLWMSSAQI